VLSFLKIYQIAFSERAPPRIPLGELTAHPRPLIAQLDLRSHFAANEKGKGIGRKEGRHRRSQGVQWVYLHPQGGEKFFSGVIYRENV